MMMVIMVIMVIKVIITIIDPSSTNVHIKFLQQKNKGNVSPSLQ